MEKLSEFYDVTDDKSIIELDDFRKHKLSLKHINKLKRMREIKKLQMSKRQGDYNKIYGKAKPDAGGMGMPPV
jgi:hypothetical protein